MPTLLKHRQATTLVVLSELFGRLDPVVRMLAMTFPSILPVIPPSLLLSTAFLPYFSQIRRV